MFAVRVLLPTPASLRKLMGRQQTLGQFKRLLILLAYLTLPTGKFFEMPKSTKAAPPQQASLQELWGKKKVVKTMMEPMAEPKIESETMVVDSLQEQTGMMNTIRIQRVLLSVAQVKLLNARNQLLQAVGSCYL